MGGPNNTAGGAAGAATSAFANTFGQFLLAKINHDENAKRQQADDRRQIFMIGLTKMMEQNPGAFADPAKLEQVFKEAGLSKSDPQALKGLANMFSTIQQGIDRQRAILEQQNAQFNALLTEGGNLPTPQTSAVGQPSPPPMLEPQTSTMSPVQMPQSTPGSMTIHTPESGPAFNEVMDISSAASIQLPPVPAVPLSLANNLSALASQTAGSLSVKSPDKLKTKTLDADKQLEVQAGKLAQQYGHFNAFRIMQQYAGGRGVTSDMRKRAMGEGLNALFQQQQELVQSGQQQQIDVSAMINSLEESGLVLTPTEQEQALTPLSKSLLSGNLFRLESQNAKARDEGRTDDIILNPYREALKQTFLQTGGRGFTEEMQAQLNSLPTEEETAVAINLQAHSPTIAGSKQGLQDLQQQKTEQKVKEAVSLEDAKATAERQRAATVVLPSIQRFGLFFQRARTLAEQGNFTAAEQAFSIASDVLDENKAAVTKMRGQTSQLSNIDLAFGTASFPTAFGAFKNAMSEKFGGFDAIDIRMSILAKQFTETLGQRVEIGGVGPELVDKFDAEGGIDRFGAPGLAPILPKEEKTFLEKALK